MDRDRVKWNSKYRKGDYPGEPSDIVREYHHLASGQSALDLAAGAGRNSVFLSRLGFDVDAVDISEAGLSLFAGTHAGLRPICADLDTFDIPRGRYDLIVNVLYVNRRLFPQIREGLKPGGLLIFESLLETPKPREKNGYCRDYYLQPNELLHAFLNLRVIYYREEACPGQGDSRPLATLVGLLD